MCKNIILLLSGITLSGCVTSTVVTGDGDGVEPPKERWEMTVSDFVAVGDYDCAEKLARAHINGGQHPALVRKVLKGNGAGDRVKAELIPPSEPCDIAMHRLNLSSVLLLEGKKAEAHDELMKAESTIEEQFDPDSQALKLMHGESEKYFKGDGYERATMYAFLALSFLERGEYDAALKRVKRGILADSDAEKGEFRADYALLPYIGYVAAKKSGREEEATGFDDIVFDICGFRPSQQDLPRSLVLVWTGGGTSRELGGEFDEIRYIRKGSLRGALDSADIVVGQKTFHSLPGLADFNYQAATRGKRMMDFVLEDKAKVKRGLAASGNFLLAFGAGCFQAAGASGNLVVMATFCAVGGLSVSIGLPTHIVGMMINAKADARSWTVLPGRLLVIPVAITDTAAEIHGYDGWDEVYRSEVCPAASRCGPGVSVVHFSTMTAADKIRQHESEKFDKPANEAVTKVREGWDKAEIQK